MFSKTLCYQTMTGSPWLTMNLTVHGDYKDNVAIQVISGIFYACLSKNQQQICIFDNKYIQIYKYVCVYIFTLFFHFILLCIIFCYLIFLTWLPLIPVLWLLCRIEKGNI